jgi:hypothetical protein
VFVDRLCDGIVDRGGGEDETGEVYEVKLSKIDTISSEKGLSGFELQNIALDKTDNSVTMYNISAALPRVKVRNGLKNQFQINNSSNSKWTWRLTATTFTTPT